MSERNEEHFMSGFIRDAKELIESNELECSSKEVLDFAIYLYEDFVRTMMMEGQECNCSNEDIGSEEGMN